MNYVERTLSFECAGENLLGIVSMPLEQQTQADIGVVIIVGGPQYRVGSHRQFVLLARALAEAGFPALRFDYRGMGDSSGEKRDFLQVTPDIDAAIGAMQSSLPAIKHVVLWGLCDGASAALLYCHETSDPRISGLCLLNPWVRSDASLARTQVKHYYLKRVMQREFWAKLIRGGVAWNALSGLARNIAVAATGAAESRASASKSNQSSSTRQTFQQRMAAGWTRFPGSILLLLSGDDYTAKEFLEYVGADTAWKNAFAHPRLFRHDLQGVDHTFSNAATRRVAENLSLQWLESQANGSRSDSA